MRGDTIAGRYRVEKLLGVGSSGFVVAARHHRLHQRVALKILTTLTDAQGRASLAVAQRVASVASPHIAKVIDTGRTEEGYPFVATLMAEGRTLAELLEARGTLPANEAVGIIRQACAGLADAHAAGVVHGDLKPQNVVITKRGCVQLVDFGMTQPLESEEGSAAWFASPAYLAPEQLRDPQVDARADIWGLGVLLHQLIAGKLPFEADTIAGMFVAVAYHEPALLAAPDVPYELAKVVQACLAKQKAGRPQSANELARQLAPFAGSDSVAPQLAMAVSLEPDELEADELEESEAAVESADLLPADTITRMAAVVQRASSRPPPLPPQRLGATPRAKHTATAALALPARLATLPRYARGWLATRIEAQRFRRAAWTDDDRRFQRRRWGAVAVVGAAGVLLFASLFASPTASAADTALAADEPVVVEHPHEFGLGAFVPPTFALPEREETVATPPPGPFTAAIVPPPPPPPPSFRSPPVRPRLAVREDPYSPYGRAAAAPRGNVAGFTHPGRLPERGPRGR